MVGTENMVSLAMRWKLSWPTPPGAKPEASGLTLIVWRNIFGEWLLYQDASM